MTTGEGERRAALFVDFDNVYSVLRGHDVEHDRAATDRFVRTAREWTARLAMTDGTPRRFTVKRCYLNLDGGVKEGSWRPFVRFRRPLLEAGFEVVDCPGLAKGGKNAADIRMCLDALDLAHSAAPIDELVLLSSDSDFSPLFQRLRAFDIRILVAPVRDPHSSIARWADRSLDIREFVGIVDPSETNHPAETGASGEARQPTQAATTNEIVNTGDAIASAPTTAASEIPPMPQPQVTQTGTPEVSGDEPSAPPGMERHGPTPSAGQAELLPTTDNHPTSATSTAVDGRLAPTSAPAHVELTAVAPPPAVDSRADGPSPLAAAMSAAHMPVVDSGTWPKVFDTVARYLATHRFHGNGDCAMWCRRQLAIVAPGLGRKPVEWLLATLPAAGLRLSAGTRPDARRIAEVVRQHIVSVAGESAIPLAPADRQQLDLLLGLLAPTRPAPGPRRATASSPFGSTPTDRGGDHWPPPASESRIPAPFMASPVSNRRLSVPAPKSRRQPRRS